MPQIDNHDRFMRLLVANQPKIYAAIRSLGLNQHDAEDVLQDTASVLWRRFDEFQEGTHFDRWACKVARLQTLSFRQKAQRNACLLDHETIEVLASDAELLHDQLAGMHTTLDECLDRLEEDDRRMLDERFLSGRTNKEIGGLLCKSESTISRALTRLYNSLLACIEHQSEPTAGGGVG
ncbi:RNA polymerase sigma factor [Planctomycetes bacterium CA13]|uniref:RNA polymerase sigma factor n=1 Tax=Novipirellula herctigrandis TaxID=2527986 RepID=A0A5C5ZC86_9BACT|nr:RNA polymerase sigma factor [Planctomycetes bacterium CA13]